MLANLIAWLRSRPAYRPEVEIFTRQWRPERRTFPPRLRRPWFVFGVHYRRTPGAREERKPKGS